MSQRIFLIITLGISLGTIAVTQFVVRPHIRQVLADRNKNLQDYQSERRLHNDTKGKLKDSQAMVQEVESHLTDTTKRLAAAESRTTAQEQRAIALETELSKANQELAGTKADLAAWLALGIPIQQIKATIAQLAKLRSKNEALQEEADILVAQWKKRNSPPTDDGDPSLPAGLTGKVLAVDPKFDFVVLDIGAEKGAQPRGVLLVARQGELVGKVRVASVQSERSIANVMPGWKLREIKEGDQVLY